MTLATLTKAVRMKFFMCKGARTFDDIAEEIGVSGPTLSRFAKGRDLSPRKMAKVEAWVDDQMVLQGINGYQNNN